ncbi:MAG TPA: hypothetical protein VFG49_00405 [Dyella sp.]|uniref:hypothetical protein n=1 Tax=Dyella sp. TaxID=1869338 RepID=UPI002D7999BE|nr:hypothetical protein [Dyella sp.]HET6551974.1 hypothetical protein [Dyella sp.]
MSKDYRPLPDSPVLCQACSNAGENIEMERQPDLPADARRWSEEQNVELQTYRCPDCEAVEVFRVD